MAKEYIERNALIAEYDRVHIGPAGGARKLMVDAPTADVVEVKYGYWIEEEACVYACSECGFTFTSADDISEFKYCRCGAKMDGKE